VASRRSAVHGWWEGSSPNRDPSAAAGTIPLVGLDRPPRFPAGAVTDRVRGAILAAAKSLQITPRQLVAIHGAAEYLADIGDIVHDVEERYQLAPNSLLQEVNRRAEQWASQGRFERGPYDHFSDPGDLRERVLNEHGAELVCSSYRRRSF
jgi:hypothetical protein